MTLDDLLSQLSNNGIALDLNRPEERERIRLILMDALIESPTMLGQVKSMIQELEARYPDDEVTPGRRNVKPTVTTPQQFITFVLNLRGSLPIMALLEKHGVSFEKSLGHYAIEEHANEYGQDLTPTIDSGAIIGHALAAVLTRSQQSSERKNLVAGPQDLLLALIDTDPRSVQALLQVNPSTLRSIRSELATMKDYPSPT